VITCANPAAQYATSKAAIDAAIANVLSRGRYVLGDEVSAFEREFAAHAGATHGIGVGSGTDAIHLALRGLGVAVGDEVITVAHTAVATVAAIELAGAIPVFVDIEPDTFTLDPSKLAAALTPRTKAVVVVHLYGHPAALDAIIEFATQHGLSVIEDCAQAHGAELRGRRVGSFGHAACFSFYPTKNLGAIGDGGMVVTRDEGLAVRLRELREYGWRARYVSATVGVNSRLDELQAAVLRVKLRRLDADNDARRAHAARYTQGLRGTGVALPTSRSGTKHVFHLFVVRSPGRASLEGALARAGIQALIHYPVPIHLQPAYAGRIRGSDHLPETERAAREVLSLPMYPELPQEHADAVIRAIQAHAGATS
jgi:dTDP-4-amino-4,6-dideoxygalactose transaminase